MKRRFALGHLQWFVRIALTFSILLLCSTPAFAHQVGFRLGGNWAILTQPDDPAGEPTLLHGSAFSGMGFSAGSALNWSFTDAFSLESQLLYNYQSASGFAEQPATQQRRTITLTSHALRLPILATYTYTTLPFAFRAGIGPELLLGLSSNATIVEENVPTRPPVLETRTATHVALSTNLGMIYHLGTTPLAFDLRLSWNPFVASATRNRFANYQDFDNPGQYTVAHTWQVLFLTGINWDFSL